MNVAEMHVGVTTWGQLGAIEGGLLAIINSPDDDRRAVGAFFDQLEASTPRSAVHVIASGAWRDWAAKRRIPAERALFALAPDRSPLELNYFLESLDVCQWVVSHRFAVIVGSLAHNLYNEEVKEIFERRVALLIGDGRFLAHALPEPFLYVLDATALVRRFGRAVALARYAATVRNLVDDLQATWLSKGSPAVDDAADFSDVRPVLARHLGIETMSYDEASPIPIPAADISHAVALMLAEVRGRLDDEYLRTIRVQQRLINTLQVKHRVMTWFLRLIGRA